MPPYLICLVEFTFISELCMTRVILSVYLITYIERIFFEIDEEEIIDTFKTLMKCRPNK